jgi:hypothetical protein
MLDKSCNWCYNGGTPKEKELPTMKTFRYIRHRICRFIYYFDACPAGYRKDFKALALEGLACAGLCIAGVFAFILMALMA